MGIDMIRKRDGREVPFDQDKIEQAIFASFQASGSARGHETSRKLTEEVVRLLENNENISAIPSVEQVQDTVEQVLMRNGFTRTAKSYILYRAERSRVRARLGTLCSRTPANPTSSARTPTSMAILPWAQCSSSAAKAQSSITRSTSWIRDLVRRTWTAISTFMTWTSTR